MPPSSMKRFAYNAQNLAPWPALPVGKLLRRGIETALLVALGTACVFAQAAVESGTATSGIAGSIGSIKPMNKVEFPSTSKGKPTVILSQPKGQKKGGSKFIEDTMIDGSIDANRKALEAHAGKEAAKLMLRSVPNGAYVRIDGKIVGRTPLLLIVRPQQYKLAMDGTRMEHADRDIDLLPHETRECTLTLKPRYPTQVKVKLH